MLLSLENIDHMIAANLKFNREGISQRINKHSSESPAPLNIIKVCYNVFLILTYLSCVLSIQCFGKNLDSM